MASAVLVATAAVGSPLGAFHNKVMHLPIYFPHFIAYMTAAEGFDVCTALPDGLLCHGLPAMLRVAALRCNRL